MCEYVAFITDLMLLCMYRRGTCNIFELSGVFAG